MLQTCMSFFLLLSTKEDILKIVGRLTKQLPGAIDYHSIFPYYIPNYPFKLNSRGFIIDILCQMCSHL